ncbi:MAG: TetR/AcrR family transcriptional regulator [Brevundimonas sp.]
MTTASPDARTRRRDANHEAIASTALALANEHGLDGFTLDDLARAAGISRRTFFNHFASKEEAVVEVARVELGRVLAIIEPTTDHESVLRVLDACVRVMLQPSTVAVVRSLIALAHANPALVPHLSVVLEEASEHVEANADLCEAPPGVTALHRIAYPGAVLAVVGAVYKRRLHVIEVDGPPPAGAAVPVLTLAQVVEGLHQLIPPAAI